MTDESSPDPTDAEPAGEDSPTAEAPPPAGAAEFTSGEGLVAFAGIVLLAVWIIFDVLVDNYGMDNAVPVVAAAAVILPRVNRDTVEKVHRLPVMMKVLGWVLALIGVVEIVIDVRFGIFDDFGVVIAALAAYAGYAMAFFGARSIEI